jgi:raffinose/stachyose/melibiose transport system permease protein
MTTATRSAPRFRLPPVVPVGLVLWALTVFCLYPLIWLIINSFKTSNEMFDQSWQLPSVWHFENYVTAWNYGLGHYVVNSVLVTTVSVFCIALIGAFNAFVLTTMEFPGKRLVYGFLLGGMIMPPEVCLFPLFKILYGLGLYDTYLAMILPYVAFGLPFATFLLRAHMVTIPKELYEAAVVDGGSVLRIFRSIYLPMSRPAIAAVCLIMLMRTWNEFTFALTFIESDSLRTLTIGISTFGDSLRVDWTVLMAGLIISILPVLGAFLLLQRQFMGGLTQGAIK